MIPKLPTKSSQVIELGSFLLPTSNYKDARTTGYQVSKSIGEAAALSIVVLLEGSSVRLEGLHFI